MLEKFRLTRLGMYSILGVFIFSLFLRFYNLGARSVHHDESLHGFFSWQFSNGSGYDHNPLMHGMFWFIANGSVFFLFGDNDFTLRLLSAIFGTILVLTPILLKDRIGLLASLILSIIFAISPHLLYFSRFARNDIIMAVWTMGLLIFFWKYIETSRMSNLYILVIFLALSFVTKETSYITVFIFGIWLLFKSRSDLYRVVFRRKGFKGVNPHTDLFVILFTLCLPLSAPLIGLFQDLIGVILIAKEGTVGVSTGLPSGGLGYAIAVIVSIVFFTISAVIGLLWGGKKWLTIASIFWGLYFLFYSTLFTNVPGIGTGLWQSLGYWISQQDVARGGQPWYYYFVIFSNYEFLPFICGVIAIIYYSFNGDSFKKFLVFWSVLTFILYSLSSEKMPWLTVNVVLPFIILTAVFSADLIRKSYEKKFSFELNSISFLTPVVLIVTLISVLLTDWSILSLESFFTIWIYITLLIVSFYYVFYCARKYGFKETSIRMLLTLFIILTIFTLKISIQSSFDNPDIPDEMIVYTQTTPHIHALSKQIYLRSLKELGDRETEIIIDTSDAYTWPWAWYLRDYRNTNYIDFGTNDQVISESPDILIIHERNRDKVEKALGDKLIYYKQEIIPHRWWFPEVYRISSYNDFFNKLTEYQQWKKMIKYFLFRDLESSIGSVKAIVYFKSDY